MIQADNYPTRRNPRSTLLERKDAVLHGDRNLANGPLSDAQLDRFERDGYLVLEGLFDAGESRIFKNELESLRDNECGTSGASSGARGAGGEPVSQPGPAQDGRQATLYNITDSNQLFFMLSRDSRIVEMVRQILQEDVYIHQSRAVVRPDLPSEEARWHSAFERWHAEDGMPRMQCLCCVLVLDEGEPAEDKGLKGPLDLIPGSHMQFAASPRSQATGPIEPAAEILAALQKKSQPLVPEAGPGTLILFDCNLMHKALGGQDGAGQHTVFFSYNSVTNTLDPPYCGESPRPEHYASHDYAAICPVTVQPSYDVLHAE